MRIEDRVTAAGPVKRHRRTVGWSLIALSWILWLPLPVMAWGGGGPESPALALSILLVSQGIFWGGAVLAGPHFGALRQNARTLFPVPWRAESREVNAGHE